MIHHLLPLTPEIVGFGISTKSDYFFNSLLLNRGEETQYYPNQKYILVIEMSIK